MNFSRTALNFNDFTSRPVTTVRQKKIYFDDGTERIIGEKIEETVVTQDGNMFRKVLINWLPLDDGEIPKNDSDIVVCSHKHVITRINSHRCPCGLVICVVKGCGKRLFDKWYCRLFHIILDKTIGCRIFSRLPRNLNYKIAFSNPIFKHRRTLR